jgi:hypothetical protein
VSSVEGGRIRAGEGWSDSKIAEALDTSVADIERTRRQSKGRGVLARKYDPNSARLRIFDCTAEAKLVALACGRLWQATAADKACDNSVRSKNILVPRLEQKRVISSQASAAFVDE